MKIQYTGKSRVRIEGIGYMNPGDERDVPASVGNDLCGGDGFREVKAPGRAVKARTRTAKDSIEIAGTDESPSDAQQIDG